MATFWKIENHKSGKGNGQCGVIYIKGCYEHCLDCPYPENFTPQWNFAYYSENCTDCGKCVSLCPYGCHSVKSGKHKLDRTYCINCKKCVGVCSALERVGFDMSGEQAYALLDKDNDGVTVSGGEPYYQFGPMMEILSAAKKDGKNTAVETFGNCYDGMLEESAPLIDEFLFAHKVSPDDYAGFCGTDYSVPQKALTCLDTLGANVTLRCTLIPGINDNDKYLLSIVQNVEIHSSIKKIQLSAYKPTAKKRCVDLGIVPQPIFNIPSEEELHIFAEKIKQNVKMPVEITE